MDNCNPFYRPSQQHKKIEGKLLLALIGDPIIKEDDYTFTLLDSRSSNIPLLTRPHSRRGTKIDFTDIINSLQDSKENLLKKHEKYVIRQENTLKLLFDLFINSTIIYSVITSLFFLAFIPQNILGRNIDIFV